jgi:hypothetical protein
MTIYKIKYILDIEEDYYLFLTDAIDAGNHYIDRIAEEEGDWDNVMITYAKNCLKNNLEFKGVVKIDEIEACASRNSVNW